MLPLMLGPLILDGETFWIDIGAFRSEMSECERKEAIKFVVAG